MKNSTSSSALFNPVYDGAQVLLFLMWVIPYFVQVPINFNIISTATLLVFVGSHQSLRLRDRAVHPPGQQDTITQQEAMQFPIVGSCVLFGLFLAIKYLDKEWINFALSFYFCGIGTFGLASLLQPLTAPLEPLASWQQYGRTFQVPLIGAVPVLFTFLDLLCLAMSLPIVVLYWQTKYWLLNNLLGIAFALQGISAVSLGSFSVSATLLVGLFFYDIFWVFGTDKMLVGESVMVTVAKNLEAPILIKFPYATNATAAMLSGNATAWTNYTSPTAFMGHPQEFSILGLGDIVIPGFFIALLLRFDATRAVDAISSSTPPSASSTSTSTASIATTAPTTEDTATDADAVASDAATKAASASQQLSGSPNADPHTSFPKPFFYNCIGAYALGLIATVTIMHFFKAAQPALLYLVPFCLGSALITADAQGSLAALFEYNEEEEEEKGGGEASSGAAEIAEKKDK